MHCAAGEHPNAGRTACERCPAGQISMARQTECHACSRGTVNNTEQAECNLCPPGTEAEGAMENASWIGSGFCRDCTPGLYSTHATQCDSCPQGHVPSPQQSFCVQCVAGEQPNNVPSPGGGVISNACERCPVAEVSGTSRASCEACPVGRVPNGEQSECVMCPPGCEAAAAGTARCASCGAGNYSTLFGSCHTCPAGHVPHVCGADLPSCVATNQTEETCEPAGSCDRCEAGRAPNSERTRCDSCSDGHVAKSGDDTCRTCPPGEVSELVGSDGSECGLCPEGQAPDPATGWRCERCSPGRTARPGEQVCSLCPSGHHSKTHGSNCEMCSGGSEPNLQQTSCVCRADYFNASLYPHLYPLAEAAGCVPCDSRTLGEIAETVLCPGGLYQTGGEARLFATPGYWLGDTALKDDETEIELQPGSPTKDETVVLYNNVLGFPFERTGSPPRIAGFVYLCKKCPGFTLTSRPAERPDVSSMNQSFEIDGACDSAAVDWQCIDGGVCPEWSGGVLCSTCDSSSLGLHMQKLPDQRCVLCEGSSYLYVAALLIGHAVFALFLDFKSRQIHVHEDGAALGILTFFLQSLALFADKEGDNAMYGIARLANLEIVTAGETEAGAPECRLDIGPFGSWYISVLWTPLYLFICSLVVFFIQERRVSHRGHIDLVRDTQSASESADNSADEGGGTC